MREFITSSSDYLHFKDLKSNNGIYSKNDDTIDTLKEKFSKIEQEYDKLAHQRGAIIHKIIRIERKEESWSLFEDADFSAETIKNLIKQGEEDAEVAVATE